MVRWFLLCVSHPARTVPGDQNTDIPATGSWRPGFELTLRTLPNESEQAAYHNQDKDTIDNIKDDQVETVGRNGALVPVALHRADQGWVVISNAGVLPLVDGLVRVSQPVALLGHAPAGHQ